MAREVPSQPPIIISSLVMERMFGGEDLDINIRLTNNIANNENHGVVSKIKNLHTGEETFVWYFEEEEEITVVAKTE